MALLEMMQQTKMYLRDNDRRPVVTIRYRPITSWPRSEGGTLYGVQYAVSTWNHKDEFDRSLGDRDAVEKLESSERLDVVAASDHREAKRQILKAMLQDRNLPHRARNLAGVRLIEDAADDVLKSIYSSEDEPALDSKVCGLCGIAHMWGDDALQDRQA